MTGLIAVAVDTEAQLRIVEEATIDPYFTAGQALIIAAATLKFIERRLLRRVDGCLALYPAIITPIGALVPCLLDLVVGGKLGSQCLTEGLGIIIGVFIGRHIKDLLGSRNHLIHNIRFRIRQTLLLNRILKGIFIKGLGFFIGMNELIEPVLDFIKRMMGATFDY